MAAAKHDERSLAEQVTGTYESGDLLENVLDELEAILGAAEELYSKHPLDPLASLIFMAHRKAKAAARLYDLSRAAAPATEAAAE